MLRGETFREAATDASVPSTMPRGGLAWQAGRHARFAPFQNPSELRKARDMLSCCAALDWEPARFSFCEDKRLSRVKPESTESFAPRRQLWETAEALAARMARRNTDPSPRRGRGQ